MEIDPEVAQRYRPRPIGADDEDPTYLARQRVAMAAKARATQERRAHRVRPLDDGDRVAVAIIGLCVAATLLALWMPWVEAGVLGLRGTDLGDNTVVTAVGLGCYAAGVIVVTLVRHRRTAAALVALGAGLVASACVSVANGANAPLTIGPGLYVAAVALVVAALACLRLSGNVALVVLALSVVAVVATSR